jgi:predicted regulator of Ras-like GTPase activity (Roadblock/LC7/MglB family)
MLDRILEEVLTSVNGSRAVIFLDGEGEAIAQAGGNAEDIKLLGAWKEIHLDQIRESARRLGLGDIRAVFFSLDGGNELLVPVSGEYCLLVCLSAYAGVQVVMAKLKTAVERLKREVE